MDSEIIEEHTETAVEHTEDLLEDVGSEDEDRTDGNFKDEFENCTKEEYYDDQDYEKDVDDESDEETKPDKDPNSNKLSKGMFKTAKKFMGAVVGPCGSKFNFNINFNIGNLASSNKKDKQESDPNAGTPGSASRKTDEKERDENAKRITSLIKDKKLLNDKLSKMQEQLSASQDENDRLKTELQNMQKQGQPDSTSSLESQHEKHRDEVKRLESELNTATESLQKMKLTNQKQMEESCRLRKELQSLSNAKDDKIKELEQKVASYRLKLEKLNNANAN